MRAYADFKRCFLRVNCGEHRGSLWVHMMARDGCKLLRGGVLSGKYNPYTVITVMPHGIVSTLAVGVLILCETT